MTLTMNKSRFSQEFWLTLIAVTLLALLLVALDQTANTFRGWIAYAVLLSIAALVIFAARKGLVANRSAVSAALVAFFLRMVIGVALALLLPVFGYQTSPEHQSGYIYTDAFFRDNQAWSLATSGDSLTTAFTGQYSGDQYGGMLALSALVYRLLNPDAHRPFLILIINATISALGVLCLWKAAGRWFTEKTALLAAWIFALYPESVLLGSSQMREAFLVPLVGISFYALTQIQAEKRAGWLLMLITAAVMFFIQPLVSFIAFAVLLGVWFFDPGTLGTLKKRRTILIIAISLSILLVTMFVVSSIMANLPSLDMAIKNLPVLVP